MRVVKINAIWCSGCLVMNKIWKNITNKYEIETLNLDYDMDEDEVVKYNVGDILPVFIFFDGDKEITRVIGEVSEKEMLNKLREVGLINEESN
jgi:thiol-disulfide isomerase/thioredoxin